MKRESEPVWVVVRATNGIPESAEVFTDQASAERRERVLAKRMNEEEDAISIIETKVKRAKGN